LLPIDSGDVFVVLDCAMGQQLRPRLKRKRRLRQIKRLRDKAKAAKQATKKA